MDGGEEGNICHVVFYSVRCVLLSFSVAAAVGQWMSFIRKRIRKETTKRKKNTTENERKKARNECKKQEIRVED